MIYGPGNKNVSSAPIIFFFNCLFMGHWSLTEVQLKQKTTYVYKK